ncbi:hypothetical protein J1N35_034627 [Gossypium stocksii]|uniref:Uncharacterized protein n=1 Tax=Gossypium stocksii TaxID=47602 RepID=A0A9D3USE5_9ROSI|nr:hypothetical protein J1N35_034627 [Gossypium stocksii]
MDTKTILNTSQVKKGASAASSRKPTTKRDQKQPRVSEDALAIEKNETLLTK